MSGRHGLSTSSPLWRSCLAEPPLLCADATGILRCRLSRKSILKALEKPSILSRIRPRHWFPDPWPQSARPFAAFRGSICARGKALPSALSGAMAPASRHCCRSSAASWRRVPGEFVVRGQDHCNAATRCGLRPRVHRPAECPPGRSHLWAGRSGPSARGWLRSRFARDRGQIDRPVREYSACSLAWPSPSARMSTPIFWLSTKSSE